MCGNKGLFGFYTLSICSLGISLVSTSAFSFEGYEHQQMSNLALTIATDYNCPKRTEYYCPGGTVTGDKCCLIRLNSNKLSNERKESDLLYGEINELVDYMHYPEQIFEHYSSDVEHPMESEHLNQHVLSLKDRKHWGFPPLDYLSASSHNERHFQDGLMESMHYLHKAAVADARQGLVYKALVRNALSDHYLNDFFAPGHITTPRENSHDAVALAMHDRANKSGTCFTIYQTLWGELAPILSFIEDGISRDIENGISREDIENGTSRDRYNFLINEKRKGKKVRDRIYDKDRIYDNLIKCGNTVGNGDELSNFPDDNLTVNLTFRKWIISILTQNHENIFLQGDGRLKDNPVQQLLMLLVQVKSISEVMQAYLQCDNNSGTACGNTAVYTTKYKWEGSYNEGKIRPPKAAIRYGQYNIKYEPKVDDQNEETWIPLLYRPKYAYPSIADDAFLLSLGGQTPIFEGSLRYELQLEYFPLTIGTSNSFERLRDISVQRPSTECPWYGGCNLGFSFGLSFLHDDSFDATSFQFRAIGAFPKISGQVSANIRRGYYVGEGHDNWKTTYGFRYDHGFSLHSFYIGLQRDYSVDGKSGFDRENVITFGWTLAFPASRPLRSFGAY